MSIEQGACQALLSMGSRMQSGFPTTERTCIGVRGRLSVLSGQYETRARRIRELKLEQRKSNLVLRCLA
jgi:hypothetical protein